MLYIIETSDIPKINFLYRLLNGQSKVMIVILGFLCAGFFVHHITYLAIINFDYWYNMQANIVVGMLHTLYRHWKHTMQNSDLHVHIILSLLTHVIG
jgi:Predicted membrane protein